VAIRHLAVFILRILAAPTQSRGVRDSKGALHHVYARHGQALAEHSGLLEPLGDPLDVLLPLERLTADMAGERVVRVDKL
jgi:hypothetical protein